MNRVLQFSVSALPSVIVSILNRLRQLRITPGVHIIACPADHDIRRQALARNLPPIRCQPLRDRHVQRRAIGQRQDILHRPFAKGLIADQFAALPILNRAGHDLRRAGRVAVDQHHQRQIARRARRVGIEIPIAASTPRSRSPPCRR